MARIVVRNPTEGAVIIDDIYENSALVKKGPLVPFSNAQGGVGIEAVYYSPISPAQSSPFIAYRANVEVTLYSVRVSNGVYTYRIMTSVLIGTDISSISGEYYIFDTIGNVPGQESGNLIIRNKYTGNVVFNSGFDYMRIDRIYRVQEMFQNGVLGERDLPEGKKIALCELSKVNIAFYARKDQRPGAINNSEWIITYYTTYSAIIGNKLRMSQRLIASEFRFISRRETPERKPFSRYSYYLLIDVTGF